MVILRIKLEPGEGMSFYPRGGLDEGNFYSSSQRAEKGALTVLSGVTITPPGGRGGAKMIPDDRLLFAGEVEGITEH